MDNIYAQQQRESILTNAEEKQTDTLRERNLLDSVSEDRQACQIASRRLAKLRRLEWLLNENPAVREIFDLLRDLGL